MSENKSYFLGLGGNLGEVEQSFILALKKLVHRLGKLEAVSSIYKSAPLQIDYSSKQDDYLNCVALFNTEKTDLEVFDIISDLEKELGRKKAEKWGPRIIDIDIIAKENFVFSSKVLQIPHPEMHKRSFVLMPLAEIAPNWIHPVLEKSVFELIADLKQPTFCKILKPFPHCGF